MWYLYLDPRSHVPSGVAGIRKQERQETDNASFHGGPDEVQREQDPVGREPLIRDVGQGDDRYPDACELLAERRESSAPVQWVRRFHGRRGKG